MTEYIHTMFRMYSSSREKVELICENGLMNTIIDRFGRNVETFRFDDTHFVAALTVAVNHIFYSWIFGFGGKVIIREPEYVKAAYRKMIEQAMLLTEPDMRAKEKSP